MSVTVPYLFDLLAMRGQSEQRLYKIGDDFFAAQRQDGQIESGELDAEVTVTPHAGSFTLHISLKGTVQVPCDRCLEPMDISIEAEEDIKVVLGPEDDDNGEMVTVDETRGTLDVSWHIYETAVLQLPLTHIHPDGQCNEAMAQLLAQHTVDAPEEED